MKRLLAYLFIVLGLGLTFNVNANSQSDGNDNFFCVEADENSNSDILQKYRIIPSISPVILTSNCLYKIYEKDFKNSFNKIDLKYSGIITSISGYELKQITNRDDIFVLSGGLIKLNKNFALNKNSRIVFKQKTQIAKAKSKTQIAKAKSSQTQKVEKSIRNKTIQWEVFYGLENWDTEQTSFMVWNKKILDVDNINEMKKSFFEINKQTKKKCEGRAFNEYKCVLKMVKLSSSNKPSEIQILRNKKGMKPEFVQIALQGLINDEVSIAKIDPNWINGEKTKISQSEPTITPKKKVNVAKVEEPKQEEFKPENKDNEAPIIEIAEAITVNDSTYEIEGKVIDKSKKLFVQIDGETIPVKKGKFKIKRFSPVDEQLKIVALDQWGNKSKPKLVNITIELKETELVEKLEQLNPSLIKSKSNKNRVALIIGIEKYEQTPAANFANLDAQYFYEYARKGFGIPKSNIKLLVDEDADLVKSISTINKWLPSKIKKNKTELIIFFAGHGLASNNGEELYILPQDSDPDLLSRTALSRTELFEQIISLSPKSVTMFMDTCYSGISRDEKMLLASARPIRIVADDQEGIPDNFTIFTASKLDQISSGLEEAKHGIFSYYLMKGLEGKADSNQDKKITNGELLAYMDENVSQKAAELGREQNPSLAGDPDKVLISYR